MLKGVAKAQRVQTNLHGNFVLVFIADNHLLVPVVVGGTLTIHGLVIIFVVTNIMAATLPLMSTIMSVLLTGVDKRFHSNCICTLIFLQVVDIEAHSVSFTNVSHGEEVPLRVVECIMVKVQEQIVLIFFDFLDFSEISGFKLGVKENCLLINIVNVKRLGRILQFFWFKVRIDSTSFC